MRVFWDVYKNIDMDQEHTLGARIRMMEQLPAPRLTHRTDTDVVFVVGEAELPAHKSVSTFL